MMLQAKSKIGLLSVEQLAGHAVSFLLRTPEPKV
jgi:hypothetical protein